MSSSSPIGARWSVIVAPLFLFGCFVAGDDGGGNENGDDPSGCRVDADCRQGRVCVDLDGNRNDICESGEECACGPTGSGTGGASNGGSAGDTNGGSTTGGTNDGGASDGGTTTGGNAAGGNATGGNATGGNATGGNATGGGAGRGGTSTGGSAGAADCGAYCTKIVAAMCSTATQNACLADCDAATSDCAAETAPALACVVDPAKTIMCQSGAPSITGCDAQLDAWNRCLVCAPATDDVACQTCSKGSCCDEIGDWILAAGSQEFYDCATACTSQTCFDGCEAMYPAAAAANAALGTCQDTSCSEECICGPSTGDDACDTCYKSNCCTEFVDYVLAPNFAEFDACAAGCTTDPCFQDCIDMYPTAGDAFVTLSDCVGASCATQCQ